MPYLVPPMDEEPPPDYVEFVAEHLPVLRGEASRLVGGSEHADEVSTEALTDIAGQWRRLRWVSRLTHRDAPGEVLRRRLAARARHWRDDQIYQVDVEVGFSATDVRTERPVTVSWGPTSPGSGSTSVGPTSVGPTSPGGTSPGGTSPGWDWAPARPAPMMAGVAAPPPLRSAAPSTVSVARRLAPLVDPTVRPQARPVAEAAIAWVHAYQRHKWRQFARVVVGVFLVVAIIIRLLSSLPEV